MSRLKVTAPVQPGSGQDQATQRNNTTPYYITIAIQTEMHVCVCYIQSRQIQVGAYIFPPCKAIKTVCMLHKVHTDDVVVDFAYIPLNK